MYTSAYEFLREKKQYSHFIRVIRIWRLYTRQFSAASFCNDVWFKNIERITRRYKYKRYRKAMAMIETWTTALKNLHAYNNNEINEYAQVYIWFVDLFKKFPKPQEKLDMDM